jgi:hypothetical protein
MMSIHDFLKTLAEACQKTGWQVHAYCLMAFVLDQVDDLAIVFDLASGHLQRPLDGALAS